MHRILPVIKVIDKKRWLEEPDDDLDEDLIFRPSEHGAFYSPCEKTIFIREDCFTLRLIIHEIIHWIFDFLKLWRWVKLYRWLNLYWDDLCLFRWHMVHLILKNNIGSEEDLIELRKIVR
jgi:hypothetical protein